MRSRSVLEIIEAKAAAATALKVDGCLGQQQWQQQRQSLAKELNQQQRGRVILSDRSQKQSKPRQQQQSGRLYGRGQN